MSRPSGLTLPRTGGQNLLGSRPQLERHAFRRLNHTFAEICDELTLCIVAVDWQHLRIAHVVLKHQLFRVRPQEVRLRTSLISVAARTEGSLGPPDRTSVLA
jgi:hypothetical protein